MPASSMAASDLRAAQELLASASSALVLTGAGLSAEAGLPTYRGRSGLWSQVDPRKFTSPDAFTRDPETVWTLCAAMRERISGTGPSSAHLALARMALERPRVTIVTQNVDGLHDRAAEIVGAKDDPTARPAEIHGSLWRLRCLECVHRFSHGQPIDPAKPPRCAECGGTTRPDIVWFGEEPHRSALIRALRAAESCRLCLVIGTSSLVAPASRLPTLAASRQARILEINPEPTPLTESAALSLRATAGEALSHLL